MKGWKIDLIKLAVKLAKVPILRDIFLWYTRRFIWKGKPVDDVINDAVSGNVMILERSPDEELEGLLNYLKHRTPEEISASGKYFVSPEALDEFCERMISEIERILFLREHRRRYHGGQIG